MKKDLIFAPVLLAIGVGLFLLRWTGMTAHMILSVLGLLILVVYAVATKKEWKLPALEILMRVCYGIAAMSIIHKIGAALFPLLLVVLFVHKLTTKAK